MRRRTVQLACAMLVIAATAWAHHSGAGVDRTKTVTITGTVKEFRWTNPHSWIDLEVTDAKGTTLRLEVEHAQGGRQGERDAQPDPHRRTRRNLRLRDPG